MDVDGGREPDLLGAFFGGVSAALDLEPNRLEPDPEKDGNEGVKDPNIAVCVRNESQIRNHKSQITLGLSRGDT